MNGPGYVSQLDADTPDEKEVNYGPFVTDSNHSDTQDNNTTTAEETCESCGADEGNMHKPQKVYSSSDIVSDNTPVNREIELSVSTSLPTTAGLNEGDEVEYNDSTGKSSPNSTPPPTADEYDKWLYHTGFEEFGSNLHEAAKAVFPNTAPSRYRNVYVLMLKWEDEDPNLPVSWEITKLFGVFKDIYHFQTEVWDIPDQDCHAEVNQKILDFSKLGGNSKEDLKIVYYAGHGKLTKNRLLSWTR